MNRIVNCFILFLIPFWELAQSHTALAQIAYADSLIKFRLLTLNSRTDAEREHYNHLFDSILNEGLLIQKSSGLLLDSVPKIGIIQSNDGEVMLVNWNLPYEDERTITYYAYLIKKSKKGETLFKLYDKGKSIYQPETKKLGTNNWLGALYYDIIEYGVKKEKRYILLAWDGNNGYTTKKMVDVLYFDAKGMPVFGDDIFENMPKPGKHLRYIMEYSADVTATIRFREKENRIVMDNLSPMQENVEGIFEFYAPDFTYNAFNLQKGKLVFERNVDVRAPASGKPFIDPQRQ